MSKEPDYLKEICANCGQTFGSHHGGNHPWPLNYCSGPDRQMDWENGPGTVFKGTGKYTVKPKLEPALDELVIRSWELKKSPVSVVEAGAGALTIEDVVTYYTYLEERYE